MIFVECDTWLELEKRKWIYIPWTHMMHEHQHQQVLKDNEFVRNFGLEVIIEW